MGYSPILLVVLATALSASAVRVSVVGASSTRAARRMAAAEKVIASLPSTLPSNPLGRRSTSLDESGKAGMAPAAAKGVAKAAKADTRSKLAQVQDAQRGGGRKEDDEGESDREDEVEITQNVMHVHHDNLKGYDGKAVDVRKLTTPVSDCKKGKESADCAKEIADAPATNLPTEIGEVVVFPTPVDCVMSAWVAKADCSKSCGGGLVEEGRSVVVPSAFGGQECPVEMDQVVACNEQPCPVDCQVGPYDEVETDWEKEGSDAVAVHCCAELEFPHVRMDGGGKLADALLFLQLEAPKCGAGHLDGYPRATKVQTNGTQYCCPVKACHGKASRVCSKPCGGGKLFRERKVIVASEFG